MNCGRFFIAFVFGAAFLALLSLVVFCGVREESCVSSLPDAGLYFTDLAVFSEAPHVRHPTLSDLRAAYREGPGAPEHSVSSLFLPHPLYIMHTQ